MTRPGPGGIVETRKVEVLSAREKKQSIYAPVTADPADKIEFYVHYVSVFSHLLTRLLIPAECIRSSSTNVLTNGFLALVSS